MKKQQLWAVVDESTGLVLMNNSEGYSRISERRGNLVPGFGQRICRVEVSIVTKKKRKARKKP